MAVHPIQSLM